RPCHATELHRVAIRIDDRLVARDGDGALAVGRRTAAGEHECRSYREKQCAQHEGLRLAQNKRRTHVHDPAFRPDSHRAGGGAGRRWSSLSPTSLASWRTLGMSASRTPLALALTWFGAPLLLAQETTPRPEDTEE